MISVAQVTIAMRPWLGMALLSAVPLAERLAFLLNAFRVQDDPDELYRALDGELFACIRRVAGAEMRVLLDDDTWVRVRADDICEMADEMMYLYFMTYPADGARLTKLNAYAMTHRSLSALRVLYTRFAEFHTSEELKAIERVMRGSYPAFRLNGWLSTRE